MQPLTQLTFCFLPWRGGHQTCVDDELVGLVLFIILLVFFPIPLSTMLNG